jgi:type II secretory pathway pseudopilin PulG
MIELLVTIGIILILATIVLIAVAHIGRSGKENATKVDLQNLQSMTAELETNGSLDTLIQFPTSTPWPPAQPPSPDPPWTVNGQLSMIKPLGGVTTPSPSDVNESVYGSNGGSFAADRWLSFGVMQTQVVMGRLRAAPTNRTTLQNLPGERFLKAQGEGPDYGYNGTAAITSDKIRTRDGSAHGTPDPPIMVDAWNNPIIFVPSGGLEVGAVFNSARQYKKGNIVETGTNPNFTCYRALRAGTLTAPPGADWEQLPSTFYPIVKAPNGRPFWASAGPDGDFQAPDDNMYSFEQ